VVEHESVDGLDVADGVDHAARNPAALQRYRHPQTQGKVERFHGALSAAMQRRGIPARAQRQIWLDEFRHEYNHQRPHEALAMKTPATVWQKSARR